MIAARPETNVARRETYTSRRATHFATFALVWALIQRQRYKKELGKASFR